MDKLYFLLMGFCFAGGMVVMWFLMKSKIGNSYDIEADIKNKKGQMVDNIFKGDMSSNELKTPKKGILYKLKEKRKLKQQ